MEETGSKRRREGSPAKTDLSGENKPALKRSRVDGNVDQQKAASLEGLALFDVPALQHLLSFVDKRSFFVTLPHVSHTIRQALTNPDLYRYNRFHLSDAQWNRACAIPWPQDAENTDEDAQFFGNYTKLNCVAGEGYAEQEEIWKKLEGDSSAQKDWQREGRHLYREIAAVERDLLRKVPKKTSRGADIEYKLPSAIYDVICDGVIDRSIVGILTGVPRAEVVHFLGTHEDRATRLGKDEDKEDKEEDAEEEEENEDGPPRKQMERPASSIGIESAAIEARYQADDKPAPTIKSHWALLSAFNEWVADNDDIDDDAVKFFNRTFADELIFLGKLGSTGCGCNDLMHAIWFGPTLRRVVDAASEASISNPVIVDLEQAPIVCIGWHNSEAIGVEALNARQWLEQGAFNKSLNKDQAKQLALWLGMHDAAWFDTHTFSVGKHETFEGATDFVNKCERGFGESDKDARPEPSYDTDEWMLVRDDKDPQLKPIKEEFRIYARYVLRFLKPSEDD